MANKNINKLIAFAAITGAAIAAGIAYFKHKNEINMFNDDLDDEEEDFDFPLPNENDENAIKREYVSLNLEAESKTVEASKTDESNTIDVSIASESNLADTSEDTTESVLSDESVSSDENEAV